MSRDDRVGVFLDVDGGLTASQAPQPGRPFRILVMGDLSGAARSATGATAELRGRRVVEIDRDRIDDVIAAFRPAVRFRVGGDAGPEVAIEFSSYDDFHPDRLLERVSLLRSLVELRDNARSGRLPTPPQPAGGQRASVPRPGVSLLDQIVGGAEGPAPTAAPAESTPADDLHTYVRGLVSKHIQAAEDPRQTAIAAQIDDTLSSLLRAILHHPEFQALESLWRGVSFLARRLETGPKLKLFVLDVARAELAADLLSDRALEDSILHRILVDETVGTQGGEPWAVCVGHYAFAETDARLLASIAAIAQRAHAPFIAAAAPSLAGLDSLESEPEPGDVESASNESWVALRQLRSARFVGLTLPRFLLRTPYDPREEPCEHIAFEELTSSTAHEDYLWGNGGLACALLLGEAFADSGWQLQPYAADVGSLPVHFYKRGAEIVAKPCAEALLTDRVALRLLDAGLMPLLSMKHGDSVRLAAFQSIAQPAAPLSGPWSDA